MIIDRISLIYENLYLVHSIWESLGRFLKKKKKLIRIRVSVEKTGKKDADFCLFF